MPQKLFAVIALTALSACSQNPSQTQQAQMSAVNQKGLEFLVEIQMRNFAKSADYCAQHSGAFKPAFTGYINNYRQGTAIALQKIGPQEGLNLAPDEKEMGTFMVLQDLQGEDMLKNVKANPSAACAKIMGVFTAMTVKTAEQQMHTHFAEYTAKRRVFCSKQPKPANCP